MTGPRFLRMDPAPPKADSSGWVPPPASPDSRDGNSPCDDLQKKNLGEGTTAITAALSTRESQIPNETPGAVPREICSHSRMNQTKRKNVLHNAEL